MRNEGELSIENHQNGGVELDPAVPLYQRWRKMHVAARFSSVESKKPQWHLAKRKTATLGQLFVLLLSSMLMALPISVMAQEQSFPSPTFAGTIGSKDADAVTEIKDYLQAVSASGWQDIKGTGTLTYPTGAVHAASLYLMRPNYSRLDITMDSGTRSLRLTGSVGRFQDEKDNRGSLPPATSSTGIVAFPRLRIDVTTSSLLSLVDQKMYAGTGQSLHRITIAYPLDSSSGSSLKKKDVATDFYFDPNTHFLVYSVESQTFNNLRKSLVRVTSYGSYQSFNGVFIPMLIRQTLNGQEQWTLQLNEVSINTNPPASIFSF